MSITTKNSQLRSVLNTTQGKTYTVLLTTVVASVLMFALAITPAYLSVTNKLKENEAKRNYIASIDKNLDTLSKLTEQEAQYQKQLSLLDDIYRNQSNDEFLSANMQAIADKYDSLLISESFQKFDTLAVNESALNQFPGLVRADMNITLIGKLENLQFVLSHLENFPLTIKINSINYALRQGSDFVFDRDKYPYSMSITAQYFYWKKL